MPKETQAYQCNYCNMVSLVKGNVTRHEKKSCHKNPNRSNCGDCKHLEFESGDETTWDSWWCPVKDLDLTGSVAIRGVYVNNNCENFELK